MRKNILIIVIVLIFLAMATGLGIAIGTIDTNNEVKENYAPYIQDGNWWIGGEDTGYPASGIDGQTPTIEVSADGYWVINGTKTSHKALGETVIPTIGEDGYWYVGDEKLGLAIAKKVEFNVSATHIQWRYEGDTEWKDLVELDDLKGADGTNGVGLDYKTENDWFYVKYNNVTEYTPVWNLKYNAATVAECAVIAKNNALEELSDLKEGLDVVQAITVIDKTVATINEIDLTAVDTNEELTTLATTLDTKVSETKTKVSEILAKIYEVFYFFSAAPGVTPEVQKVVAGEVLELLVPNQTQLINGQVTWYSYELNSTTNKYELVEITDGYVMPERDLYLYANYNGQIKPTISFELDGKVHLQLNSKYFDNVTVEDLNNAASKIDFTTDELKGYELVAWFFDEDFLFPIEDFTILGDLTVYAKLEAKPFNVTFDLNYGESTDSLTQVVKYKEYVTPITATRQGYTFAGWYLDGATQAFDFTKDTMPAEDITLTAKWEVIDVVGKVAKRANEAIADVFNVSDVNDSPVYISTTVDTFINPENENVELVNKVYVNINLDKLAEFRSLSIDKGFFNKANLLDIVRDVLADVFGSDALVNDMSLLGNLVFDNQQFLTSNLNDILYSVIDSVLLDFKNEVNPTLNVYLNDVICGRNIDVEIAFLGSTARIEKARDFANRISNLFQVSNNGNLDITFEIPSQLIVTLEEYVMNNFSGLTLYQALNNLTVIDMLHIAVDKDKDLLGIVSLLEKVAPYLYNQQALVNRLISSSRYELVINGMQLFANDATFAPASSSYEDIIQAVLDIINPDILNSKIQTFDANNDGVYNFAIDAMVDLGETDKVDQTVINQQVVLNVVIAPNTYEVVLDANGGTLDGGGSTQVVTGVMGTLIHHIIPTNGTYKFGGWYDETGKRYYSVPAENITLTAKWLDGSTPDKEYGIDYILNQDATLTYVDADGLTQVETTTDSWWVGGYKLNSTPQLAKAVDNTGTYKFVGWEIRYQTYTYVITEIVDGEVVFIADAEKLIRFVWANLPEDESTVELTAIWEKI